MGSDGWVRSSAWIWLFSSTQSTTALAGGFRYSPTTSVSFSTNCGSRDNLKVSTRWGCRPWASQIRCTVAGLTPWACAMVRQLQWVAALGLVCSVASTTCLIFFAEIDRLRPRPAGAQLGSNLPVGESVGGHQDDPRAEGDALGRVAGAHPSLEDAPLFWGDGDSCSRIPHGSSLGGFRRMSRYF